jgi:hypothetical protein
MNARTLTCAVLVGLGWSCAVAQGQQDMPAQGVQPPPIQHRPLAPQAMPAGNMAAPDEPLPGAMPAGPSGLSDWILYRRPGSGCCEPGPLRPIYADAYLRVGPSVPVGGTYLGRELLVGWTIEGGVRALFFDAETTSAWVVDAGVVNTNNGALSPGTPVVLEIAQPPPSPITGLNPLVKVPVTVHNYNFTMGSLGFGKEYYLWEPANAAAGKWRIGWDGGGRYGSSSMTFNEIRHRTRTAYGTYLAAHADYEIPCGCCFIAFGVRAEWAYTWSTILQKATDLQDINALVTFSVRY